MSNAVLPTFAGLKWDKIMSPEFSTKTQRSVNGRELRAAFMQYPLWTFKQAFEVLRDSASLLELQTLIAFFCSRNGSFDSFLFTNPDDYAVTAYQFGLGTGAATQFQLVRQVTGGGFSFVEPVQNVNAITGIYDNGTPVVEGAGAGKYTISSTGLVTFGTAPVAAHSLTWTGTYYYRVRFLNDKQDFKKLMMGLWSADSFDFIGATGNKV